ncbi:ribosome hibernation-promoting factor, HPF/YfiA family [Melghirimyces algeriensis]|uniref:Ribosome hibernation promoting factor n=1 Tax=Melghirimyces algeriensis TaxID=910412 RepID=A0A521D3K3_9BACL|nr:ribosome-associated translation inhibitor RaiA [Melghirimyces algeriensis]SMO66273.1 putative sigma-54 modulation protein [Melghirimyces algeriensis]
MKYNIRGNNIDVTEALRDYVVKKLSRLEKYFEATSPVTPAHVSLSVFRDEHKVEVTVPFPELLIRAEEATGDMYASIDRVVEKLERQIRKYKTKVNRKFRQDGTIRNMENGKSRDLLEEEQTEDESEFEVVRTKRFDFKPMDMDEAILQMDLLGHNFYVFSNAATDQVNVVYKRKDGRYGLIEPE